MVDTYTGKIIVIGDTGTGKSSLLRRYFSNDFYRNEKSTIGVDFKIINKKIDDKYNIKLHVWDTSGQERFNSIIEQFFRNTTCVILVYDITNDISLESIDKWVEKVKKNDEPGFIYLIGNKIDMERFREVKVGDASFLANKLNARFFETSAKTNIDSCVNKMFDSIVSDVYNIIKYNPDKLDKYHIKKTVEEKKEISILSYVKKSSKKCCIIM
jgi:small GTP-binding protein